MKIGFTGTRDGMTLDQKSMLMDFLNKTRIHSVIHGGCVGADEEFHEIAKSRGLHIEVFLPINRSKTSSLVLADEGRPNVDLKDTGLKYLLRNHKIVDHSSLVVAAPKSSGEVLRSGTWATVRYASRRGIPVFLLLPNLDPKKIAESLCSVQPLFQTNLKKLSEHPLWDTFAKTHFSKGEDDESDTRV